MLSPSRQVDGFISAFSTGDTSDNHVQKADKLLGIRVGNLLIKNPEGDEATN